MEDKATQTTETHALRTYIIRVNTEAVPKLVERLVVDFDKNASICGFQGRHRLMEVEFRPGLKLIKTGAFQNCLFLRTVRFQQDCNNITILSEIDSCAFEGCSRLQSFQFPVSVESLGNSAFYNCVSLREANLSETHVTEIPESAFEGCESLFFAGMPTMLECIEECAFAGCRTLVTVLIQQSTPITVGSHSFRNCTQLVNFVLPPGSTVEEGEEWGSFTGCDGLHEMFGGDSVILAGLVGRFESLPAHKHCYDNPTSTAILVPITYPLLDRFGMTPLHVLFSRGEPSNVWLENILQIFVTHADTRTLLRHEDGNGERAVDYLVHDWTSSTGTLLRMFLEHCVSRTLLAWGAKTWVKTVDQELEKLPGLGGTKDDRDRAKRIETVVVSLFLRYEIMECVNMLELAIWKASLRYHGRNADGSKRQAVTRNARRHSSGSSVTIPLVVEFL